MTGPVIFADTDVFHARLRPAGLTFSYSVMSIFVDIDRLEEPVGIPLLSLGRFNLFGFDIRDHGPRDGTSLRPYIDRLHDEAALARPVRVTLVCFPRILGFVFNPVSTYLGTDAAGRTTSVVYEVRNTFGQHHSYLLAVVEDADGAVEPHECDKLFYVSPFMDMPLRYRFRLSPLQDDSFTLKIIERDRDGVVLTALMRAKAFEATTAALLTRLARTPLLCLKVVAAIHWQALRLWLKGHHLRPRPMPPRPVTHQVPGEFTLSAPESAPGVHHA